MIEDAVRVGSWLGKRSWCGKLQTEARQASNSYGTRAQPVRRVPPLCVCLFCSILYTSSLVQFNDTQLQYVIRGHASCAWCACWHPHVPFLGARPPLWV